MTTQKIRVALDSDVVRPIFGIPTVLRQGSCLFTLHRQLETGSRTLSPATSLRMHCS
jgi:hypothetical protein